MKTILFSLTLAFVPAAWATSISYSFTNPTGALGTSQTYISDGVTITAYGFENGESADLFANSNGLGLVANGDQISNGFIQLNLANLWAADPTGLKITIGDVQPGESWEIFGSNALGSLGTQIQTGSSNAPASTALTASADQYKYISITAAMCSDVVLTGLSGNSSATPEPGSLAMMGVGAALVGVAKLRIKRKA